MPFFFCIMDHDGLPCVPPCWRVNPDLALFQVRHGLLDRVINIFVDFAGFSRTAAGSIGTSARVRLREVQPNQTYHVVILTLLKSSLFERRVHFGYVKPDYDNMLFKPGWNLTIA